ncbi:ABC transporter ATP-binding protein [Ruegeria meonggei]|uniref:Aliphatic sulfonates import ATP-binding protein SsuB n=1 Tax=Ruegeria meonggei TaxID=1446476 RepID=A0A1X7A406_9RHOB|nr:ATP-binding cassette domain-containing protein [Ruegeria meonggei]SLN69431.1 Aliphatic sulfonates import ATP-binding protein SsuB [Ruegeria meonggei]
MIRIDIRQKRFGNDVVLGPVSFDIAAGETIVLTGPSGIGKTTLLRLVAGIDPDFDGQIVRPDRLAIVFQEPTLLPWRSASDNLILVHPSLSRADVEAALTDVGLDGKGNLFPGQLSLGQQRRLSLARAFAGQPEFLIMDEPFVSLDAETVETMLTLTEDLIAQHGPATLFVTHSQSEAQRLSNRILNLISGPDGAVLG